MTGTKRARLGGGLLLTATAGGLVILAAFAQPAHAQFVCQQFGGTTGGATAAGSANVATGRLANASGFASRNIATGAFANASGTRSQNVALGRDANASGDGTSNTAVGASSVANGANASAFGSGSSATHDNSAAFGQGATTSRDNQQVFGTATNTYMFAGIASAASAAAQGTPIGVVTTDAEGNLAVGQIDGTVIIDNSVTTNKIANNAVTTNKIADDAVTLAKLAPEVRGRINDNTAAIQTNAAGIARNAERIDENAEGVAMAIAMGGTYLPRPGETFRVSGNWGNFEGSDALSFSGALALGEGAYLTGGVGFGLEHDTVGSRAGFSMGW